MFCILCKNADVNYGHDSDNDSGFVQLSACMEHSLLGKYLSLFCPAGPGFHKKVKFCKRWSADSLRLSSSREDEMWLFRIGK